MYHDKEKVKWSVTFLDAAKHEVTEYFDREESAKLFAKKHGVKLKEIKGLPDKVINGIADPVKKK